MFNRKTIKLRGATFKVEELDAVTYGRIKDKYTSWDGMNTRTDDENMYREWLATWIKEWSLRDNGKPLIVSKENVEKLPRSVFDRLCVEFNLMHRPAGVEELVKELQKGFLPEKAG